MKNTNTYILPSEAQELIFGYGLGDFYFETNFKKIKFRNKGVSVMYDYDEVLDWCIEKYPLSLEKKFPMYAFILFSYESLDHEQIWAL